MRRRIAVLWHARQDPANLHEYAIGYLADLWRDEGLEVIDVFGTGRFVPADVCLVHVDLSVVPERYLRFARRYPVTLNGSLGDIRKSVYSQLRLTRSDDYAGQVIVKTNRNHGGRPERKLAPFDWLRNEATPIQRRRARRRVRAPLPYRIYDGLSDVPARYFGDREWIVERFLPEEEDGAFHVRNLNVLGGAHWSVRLTGAGPIVGGRDVTVAQVEPHPQALEVVARLGIDYGKVDYVVRDGEAFVLDVNKTTGGRPAEPGSVTALGRIVRAAGICEFLDDVAPRSPLQPRSLAPVSA